MAKGFLKFFLLLLVIAAIAFAAVRSLPGDAYQLYGWVDRSFASVSLVRRALDQSAGQCVIGQANAYVRRGENWEAFGPETFPFSLPIKMQAQQDPSSLAIQSLQCRNSTGEKFSLILRQQTSLRIERAKNHPLRVRPLANVNLAILGQNIKLNLFTEFGDLTISSQGDTNISLLIEENYLQNMLVRKGNVAISLANEQTKPPKASSIFISVAKNAQLFWGPEKKAIPPETTTSLLPSGLHIHRK